MVKRQTVWLSTMMVLSLMLIGYYTMNNSSTTTSAKNPGTGATVTTTQAGTTSTSNDWFTSQQTALDQQMSQKISTYQTVIQNTSASADDVNKAQTSLQQLESLKSGLQNATDAVIGDGYQNCVIVPDSSGTSYHIYVQADKFGSDDVVKIMNMVSQEMNVPMLDLLVTQHK